MKTANCCFPASLSAYDREPVFKENLLVFEGKFYLIGEGHKEFLADKTKDLDYYVLALAAIARELNIRKMTCGKIRIAAGLPLTWVSGQRDEFRDYLLQNKAVDFSFRNVSYHVEIVGVDVFPQGFAAVADRLSDFRGVNMICDKNCPHFAFGVRDRHRRLSFHGAQLQTARRARIGQVGHGWFGQQEICQQG